MKLLLENWRQYLDEQDEGINTLIIYDFDETLGRVENDFVEFVDGEGNVVHSVVPGDYAGYNKFYGENKSRIGKEIFFKSPLLQQVVEKYGQQIAPYKNTVSQMKSDIQRPEVEVIVLTARPSEDVSILKQVIHQDFGVPEIGDKIYGVGGMGDVKGKFLLKLLKQFPDVTNIVVHDDKQKNLDGIQSSLAATGEYNFDLNLVKHGK